MPKPAAHPRSRNNPVSPIKPARREEASAEEVIRHAYKVGKYIQELGRGKLTESTLEGLKVRRALAFEYRRFAQRVRNQDELEKILRMIRGSTVNWTVLRVLTRETRQKEFERLLQDAVKNNWSTSRRQTRPFASARARSSNPSGSSTSSTVRKTGETRSATVARLSRSSTSTSSVRSRRRVSRARPA